MKIKDFRCITSFQIDDNRSIIVNLHISYKMNYLLFSNKEEFHFYLKPNGKLSPFYTVSFISVGLAAMRITNTIEFLKRIDDNCQNYFNNCRLEDVVDTAFNYVVIDI